MAPPLEAPHIAIPTTLNAVKMSWIASWPDSFARKYCASCNATADSASQGGAAPCGGARCDQRRGCVVRQRAGDLTSHDIAMPSPRIGRRL